MTEVRERKFEPGMTVEQALALHPSARWVFAAWHLNGCRECPESAGETLTEVARGYGLPLEQLLGDLNSLLQS